MALQRGASNELLERTLAAVKSIRSAATFDAWVKSQRTDIIDRLSNIEAAARAAGGRTPLTGGAAAFAPGGFTPAPAGSFERFKREAKSRLASMSDAEFVTKVNTDPAFQRGLPLPVLGVSSRSGDGSLKSLFAAVKQAPPDALAADIKRDFEAAKADEASRFGLPQLAVGIGAAGVGAGLVSALSGNSLLGRITNVIKGASGGGSGASSAAANAVPGLSTGGQIPGTNIQVGTPGSSPTGLLDRIKDIAQRAARGLAQPGTGQGGGIQPGRLPGGVGEAQRRAPSIQPQATETPTRTAPPLIEPVSLRAEAGKQLLSGLTSGTRGSNLTGR